MRDAERLDKFYDRLKELHKKYCPDWRFGQLMVNLAQEMGDPFYWEENRYLEIIEEYMQKTFVKPVEEKRKKMLEAISLVDTACKSFGEFSCKNCPIYDFIEDTDMTCYVLDLQDYLSNCEHGAE